MVTINPAPFTKRLLAIFYDLILIAALFIIASAIAMLFNNNQPFAGNNFFMLAWLDFVGFLYFGVCWKISGQTLGLKTWRLRLVAFDNKTISWQQVIFRYFLSPILFLSVIGFVWMLFNKKKITLYDLITKTKIIDEKSIKSNQAS